MQTRFRHATGIWLIIGLVLVPGGALGEWSGDVYLGMHSSDADDMSIILNGAVAAQYSDSDTGSVFGGRIGYWFESMPWLGIAMDLSVAELDFNDINIGVGAITPLLMFRLNLLPSDIFTKGRLQPYAGIGTGFYFGGMSEFIEAIPPNGGVLDDVYFTGGIDARGGVCFLINAGFGVFCEYAYKQFSPSFESTTWGGKISFEPTFKMHTYSAGLSFRF